MENPREKLFDFAAFCLWIIASIAFAFYLFVAFGQDFRGYYAAARVLLEGGNPYDYAQVTKVLLEVTGRAGNNPFYYPLWFGWFVAPFSVLSFQTARAVWMLFNWALWIFGLFRMQQLLDFPSTGWRRWLLYLLTTFIFAWTTWKFEQTGILLFVITVEILIANKNQQWNRMGIFMALALIKPNIMLLPIGALGLWLLLNKNWRPVRTASICLLGLILVTSLITPDWYQPFLRPHFGRGLIEVLDGPDQVTGVRLNTTLLDWLKWFSLPDSIRTGIYVIALIAAIWILWRCISTSNSILEVMIVSLLVSFTITPYALQYDFPPLVLVLFWALAMSRYAKSKLVPIMVLIFITSVLIWERPISDGYWIVLGLIILTVWVERVVKKSSVAEPALSHSQ
jgi:glycosyl transferase family 87